MLGNKDHQLFSKSQISAINSSQSDNISEISESETNQSSKTISIPKNVKLCKSCHLNERYLYTDIQSLFQRVASHVSKNKIEYDLFYKIMTKRYFCPAGNTLTAGKKPVAPNCTVFGTFHDTPENIQLAIDCWKSAIGIGFDLSAQNDPVAILQKLNDLNLQIKLDHRPARGNMATLSVTHPKILDFIRCKMNNNISRFNISVKIDSKTPPPEKVLKEIANAIYKCGDPGIIFPDKFQDPGCLDLEPIVTCVPCGEQALHKFESCNLGSINLAQCCIERNGKYEFNWKLFKWIIPIAVRFLDNVVDILELPNKQMKNISLKARRIGLGVMGWSDCLKILQLKYSSPNSLALAESIAQVLKTESLKTSKKLGIEHKNCFYADRRNITTTCIAPTGGIAPLFELEGFGIEPPFPNSTVDGYSQLDMQNAWQKHICKAVSKTVSVDKNTSVDTILNYIKYSFKLNVKGITIYRDSSKAGQPM